MKPNTIHLFDGRELKARSLGDYSSWDTTQWDEFATGKRADSGAIDVATAYREVAWFKRCVDIRARAVATLPFSIYRGDDAVWSDSTDRPDELAWLSLSALAFRATQSLILAGAAYAYIESVGRRIVSLVCFDPYTMQAMFDSGGHVVGFKRTVNNAPPVPVPIDDVWHVFAADALTEVGPGAPDAVAAASHARVLRELAGYTADQLGDGLVKRTVFTSAGPRPPEEARREVESFLTRLLYGRQQSQRARVIGGDVKPTTIGSDLTDLAAREIAEEHQHAIATGLGVPHSLIASNAANYATAQQDAVNFVTGVVASDAALIADAVNRQLLSRYDLTLRYEPERVEALQVAEQQKATSSVALVTAGILTVDEARAALGYAPLDELEAPTPTPVEPEPEAPVEDEEESEPQSGKSLDVQRWRTKVERKGADVRFSPDHLTDDEADVIRARLQMGYPVDEAFLAPYSDF